MKAKRATRYCGAFFRALSTIKRAFEFRQKTLEEFGRKGRESPENKENFCLHFKSVLCILKIRSGESGAKCTKVVLLTQKCRRVEPSDFPEKEGAAALPSSQQLQGSPKGGSALTGQYQHSIDAKGRVFIPAKLREELGETFYVTMGMDSCLSVYSDASWAKFTEKFESLPYTKTKAMRPLFANAAKCEPDSQGRILLPQKLRAYAGLDKDVVIIGVSNRAEIWNAERWAALEAEELNPENLAAVMEELGF